MRMKRSWFAVVTGALVVGGASSSVHAFQIETAFTTGCHERVTLAALADSGWPGARQAPASDETTERILSDLPFDLPAGAADPWGMALIIGVRSNDLGSADPFDLAALSTLHNDPARQPEHCLRQEGDDREQGDVSALASCRAFIMDELEAALGTGDEIDTDATVSVETFLVFRGRIDLNLNRYGYHLGRAVHALEDSYTHTFRNPDDARVRHVLNWIEGNLGSSHNLARDGHPHVAALDECDVDEEARQRHDRAAAAVADLMAAVNDDGGGRDGRLDRAAAALDRHLVREEGCVEDNEWCGTGLMTSASGCSAASTGHGGAAAVGLLLGLAGLGLRSRRARSGTAIAALIAAIALSPTASAGAVDGEEEAPAPPPVAGEAPPSDAPDPSDATTEGRLDREDRAIKRMPDQVTRAWGVAFNVGGAFDRAAGAVSLGARWNPWRSLGFGLDAEYNPWVSVSASEVAAGAASLYVPVIWRIKRFGTWELRSTASAGATMLLFDLVGVDKGDIGLFLGWNPLGLALPLGSDIKLVVKPGDIAVSAPQLRGIPFYYHQYRFTVGIEWYP
jgi:hypothetical protein